MNKFQNRLINESSPYLLQHAHNPVDWYPWGPEALELAQRGLQHAVATEARALGAGGRQGKGEMGGGDAGEQDGVTEVHGRLGFRGQPASSHRRAGPALHEPPGRPVCPAPRAERRTRKSPARAGLSRYRCGAWFSERDRGGTGSRSPAARSRRPARATGPTG